MDTKAYEKALFNMDVMGFDDEEREMAMSDEQFLECIARDPERYDKKYFRMLINECANL